MCSSFEGMALNDHEIGDYIKKYGHLISDKEPYVFTPDLHVNGYEYDEKESFDIILPFGLNNNDKAFLPNSVFVLINDSRVNALSAIINSRPIVGLYIGSIIEIDHIVNMMIGSMFENNFPIEKFKKKEITISDGGYLEIKSEENVLGYKDERIFSYLIKETTLRFLVLHEIGHHYRGHFSKKAKDSSFFTVLKANDDTNSNLEIEADTFASQNLAKEFSLVLQELIKHKQDLDEYCTEEITIIALNIMITSMTIPFSVLYKPIHYDESSIKETITYRELYALMTLVSGLYENNTCRQAAVYELCNKTNNELKEMLKITNKSIDIDEIKSNHNISFYDFCIYMAFMFVNSKQVFFEIRQQTNVNTYIEDYINELSCFLSAREYDNKNKT